MQVDVLVAQPEDLHRTQAQPKGHHQDELGDAHQIRRNPAGELLIEARLRGPVLVEGDQVGVDRHQMRIVTEHKVKALDVGQTVLAHEIRVKLAQARLECEPGRLDVALIADLCVEGLQVLERHPCRIDRPEVRQQAAKRLARPLTNRREGERLTGRAVAFDEELDETEIATGEWVMWVTRHQGSDGREGS